MLPLPDETVTLLAVATVGFRTPGVAARVAAHDRELYPTDVRMPHPLTAEPAAFGLRVTHLVARATSSTSVAPVNRRPYSRAISTSEERVRGRVSHRDLPDVSSRREAPHAQTGACRDAGLSRLD